MQQNTIEHGNSPQCQPSTTPKMPLKNEQPTKEELFRFYGIKARDFAEEQSRCKFAPTVPPTGHANSKLTRRTDYRMLLCSKPTNDGEGTYMRNGVECSREEAFNFSTGHCWLRAFFTFITLKNKIHIFLSNRLIHFWICGRSLYWSCTLNIHVILPNQMSDINCLLRQALVWIFP